MSMNGFVKDIICQGKICGPFKDPFHDNLGSFLVSFSDLPKQDIIPPKAVGARYGEWGSHPGRGREELKQHHRTRFHLMLLVNAQCTAKSVLKI